MIASALLDSLLDAPAPAGAAAADVRADARARLAREGLPGPRDEGWKYTSLRALGQRRFVDADRDASQRAIDAQAWAVPGATGARLVFLNGVFRPDLSDLRAEAGLAVVRLGEDRKAFEAALRTRSADDAGRADAFVRANTALAVDGVLLRVEAGARIGNPVHLVFAGAAADADLAWHLRLRVEVGTDASLCVIEHHVGVDAGAHLANCVTDATLGPRARLDWIQLQAAGVEATLVRSSRFGLEADACLFLHALDTGARLGRQDLAVDLHGRGAGFTAHGVFALQGRQHGDTQLAVLHGARDTTSDVTWRGVADQRARGVFRGAITVATGADGADAQLSSRNLLLSEAAEIDTQPVLEIHADEVKAAHGASVGQLDEHALFYLRTRGIPLADARRLLVTAFCGGVLSGLPPGVRSAADGLLAARLPQDGVAA